MTTPAPPPDSEAPEPASVWIEDHEPPEDEARRQAVETVRSVSRLEESS